MLCPTLNRRFVPEPDIRAGYRTQNLRLSRSESRKGVLEINLKAFGAMGYADRSWQGIQNIRQWEDAHDCDRERRAAG
jgi:hypothetical protein